MSRLTLSRTIPAVIFTILASYTLWESHARYKKRQRLRQTVALVFFFVSGFASWNRRLYNNQLPGDIESWKRPGDNREDLEEIWIKLDKVFRDAGFTLWKHAFSYVLRIADYPSSSGFGYALPSRGNEGVGSLRKLRQFQYNVGCFICLFNSLSNIYR